MPPMQKRADARSKPRGMRCNIRAKRLSLFNLIKGGAQLFWGRHFDPTYAPRKISSESRSRAGPNFMLEKGPCALIPTSTEANLHWRIKAARVRGGEA